MYRKTMRAALEEARQYKDPKTEYMVAKDGKTIVIDKKDWPTYQAEGWKLAEEVKVNIDNDIIDLFETVIELNEFTDAHIKQLQIAYRPLRGKRLSDDQINKLKGMIKKMSISQMKTVAHADIPFLASMTKTHLVLHKGMKWSDFKRPLDMSYEPEELDESLQLSVVKQMTKRNDHFGARIYIAQKMKDRELEDIYQSLEISHRKYGRYVGNLSIQTRDKLEKLLYGKIVGKWGTKAGDKIIKEL